MKKKLRNNVTVTLQCTPIPTANSTENYPTKANEIRIRE